MKFHGSIGFWLGDKEEKPGVWKPEIVEKTYFGDVLQNSRRLQDSEYQNDNLTTNNRLSIISDLYLRENWHTVRYVIWNGVKWKVSNVTINDYPRITLQLGGVYNGTEPVSS